MEDKDIERVNNSCSPQELAEILRNINSIQISEDKIINFSFTEEEINKLLDNPDLSFILKFSPQTLKDIIPQRIKKNLINLDLLDEESAQLWKSALINLPQLLYINPDLILNNVNQAPDKKVYIRKALKEPKLFLRYSNK